MSFAFAGISKARERLQKLADGLRDTGVLPRAVEKVQALVNKVAHEKTSRHIATGAADASITVTASGGGLIQLASNSYLRFHSWWSFRRGMPPFILKQAAVILARELLTALGSAPGGELAREVVEEADADEAKRATKKADRERRKAERAYNRKVKRQEARE